MEFPNDIITHNNIVQTTCLYQLLTEINNNFDKNRRDILYQDPLPYVETVYATIRRDILMRGIIKGDESLSGNALSIRSSLAIKRRTIRPSSQNDGNIRQTYRVAIAEGQGHHRRVLQA